jgi:hypothetical protein
MQSLTLHTHVGKDGILKLETPIKFKDAEVDVVLVVNSSTVKSKTKTKKEKDWPLGFFEKTFGSIPDFPDRAPQGEYEIREALE